MLFLWIFPMHSILYGMDYYWINGSFINIIQSLLTNRRFKVRINGSESDIQLTTTGVPQGSPISQILFLCYINGFASVNGWAGVHLHFYAVDTVIYTGGSHQDYSKRRELWVLQSIINSLYWFCNEHGLSINPTKTPISCLFLKKE